MLLIEYDYFYKSIRKLLEEKRKTYNLKLHVMSLEESHCDELALLAPA